MFKNNHCFCTLNAASYNKSNHNISECHKDFVDWVNSKYISFPNGDTFGKDLDIMFQYQYDYFQEKMGLCIANLSKNTTMCVYGQKIVFYCPCNFGVSLSSTQAHERTEMHQAYIEFIKAIPLFETRSVNELCNMYLRHKFEKNKEKMMKIPRKKLMKMWGVKHYQYW